MTTYPSNRNQDWTATQAAPWQTPSPDAATMAAYFPPTAARPAYGQAFGQPQMAWSAEQPEFNSAPAPYPTQQPWYSRPRVLAFAGAGLVAAAAAGLFGALHGSSSSTPVNTAAQSAPAPAARPQHRHPCLLPSRQRPALGRRTTRRGRAVDTPRPPAIRHRRRLRRPRKDSPAVISPGSRITTTDPIPRSGTTAATTRGRTGAMTTAVGRVTTTAAGTSSTAITTATTAARQMITTTADRLITTTADRLITTTAGRRTIRAAAATRPDRTRAETRSDNSTGAARPQGRAARHRAAP